MPPDFAIALGVSWINETLLAPWTRSDVGLPNAPGFADYAGPPDGSGTYTVSGEGDPGVRSGRYDEELHFVHQPVSGEFEIVARLTDMAGKGSKAS